MEEKYEIKNTGARHAGSFSRLKYAHAYNGKANSFRVRTYLAATADLAADLPLALWQLRLAGRPQPLQGASSQEWATPPASASLHRSAPPRRRMRTCAPHVPQPRVRRPPCRGNAPVHRAVLNVLRAVCVAGPARRAARARALALLRGPHRQHLLLQRGQAAHLGGGRQLRTLHPAVTSQPRTCQPAPALALAQLPLAEAVVPATVVSLPWHSLPCGEGGCRG